MSPSGPLDLITPQLFRHVTSPATRTTLNDCWVLDGVQVTEPAPSGLKILVNVISGTAGSRRRHRIRTLESSLTRVLAQGSEVLHNSDKGDVDLVGTVPEWVEIAFVHGRHDASGKEIPGAVV